MPAKVKISQVGQNCWELEVKLVPEENNDPKTEKFRDFLRTIGLIIYANHGWSARGYETLTIRTSNYKKAEEVKNLIEEWGEKNLGDCD